VVGYRSEPDVAPDSNTETFVALKLQIDNWRWAASLFYLRTGKRLAQRMTEIVIQFRRTPFVLFRNTTVKNLETNRLVIHIQPDEGISLSFGAKVPGSVMKLRPRQYGLRLPHLFRRGAQHWLRAPPARCMAGDATLFQRADMVEAGWSVIQPILDVWHALPRADSPTTRPAPGGPLRPTNCSKKMAAHGAGRAKRKSTSAGASPRRAHGHHHVRGARVDREIRILPDLARSAKRAAQEFVQAAAAAVRAKGSFTWRGQADRTPKALYSLLVNRSGAALAGSWIKYICSS